MKIKKIFKYYLNVRNLFKCSTVSQVYDWKWGNSLANNMLYEEEMFKLLETSNKND